VSTWLSPAQSLVHGYVPSAFGIQLLPLVREAVACAVSAAHGGRLPARLLPPRLWSIAYGKPVRDRRLMRLQPTRDQPSILLGPLAA
ncbi:hypothetical protein B296_00029625, partial [Ensete ventricosum]